MVAVVGEAGVGKSRLVYEFVHSHRTQGWLVLESASVSYGKATPYFPVLDLLRRYCHLEDGDDSRTLRAKVTGHVLTLDAALQEAIPALLSLLDALPDDSPFFGLEPSQRRQCTLDALKQVLLRESQVQPLVLVFEDLHWIDTETQALLDSLVESLPTARVLLLLNYRPEYQHGWGSKTYYTQLRLDPLPPVSANALLQALLGDDASLAPLTQLLIARTQGNPFFLEESVRTLVETQVLVGERGAYRLAESTRGHSGTGHSAGRYSQRASTGLPPEEKQLLQTAAVIGTEVSLPLLQAIAELSEEALQRGLAHLQAAEFLYEIRLFPEREYTFKHALTHEVAYGSLLQERRRALHARIVESLEAGDRVPEQVERLAHHALRGEVWDKALAYCRQAGEKAMARSAHREAVEYFEQALSTLPHLPERRDTREQSIDLRLALRSALGPLSDAGERVLAYLREAEALAVALDDSRRLGQVLRFLSIVFTSECAYNQAIATGQRALALATAGGDDVPQAQANFRLGQTYQAQGDYRRAIAYFGQTVASLEGERRLERFGDILPPAIAARARLAICHAELGTFAEGRAHGEEGLRDAEAGNHPASRIMASWGSGWLALRQGHLSRALSLLERAVGICQDADIVFGFPAIAAALGEAYILGGRADAAVPLLTQGMEQATAMATRWLQSPCHLPLGEAQMLAGRMEEAHALAEQALAHARAYQERSHQAYALRLLGEIAARHEPLEAAPAEEHYRQALTLADELGMRPLVAHCHRSLGTLYAANGQREQARVELAAAINLYRALDMTFWLPQVEAALVQVE